MKDIIIKKSCSTGEQATVSQALKKAASLLHETGISSARLDSELLLCRVLKIDRVMIYGSPERRLTERELADFFSLIELRRKRKPVQYLIGKQEFWSREFILSEEVLVPRPETEILIETIIAESGFIAEKAIKDGRNLRVLDIGTGSGIIAVTLVNTLKSAEIFATDISIGAVKIAKLNASTCLRADTHRQIGSKISQCFGIVRFLASDVFNAFPDGMVEKKKAFDIIVSNPPYIESGEIDNLEPEVAKWEPRLALDGGRKGTDVIEKIIRTAFNYLFSGGMLLIETGEGQKELILPMVESTGMYSEPVFIKDYSGRERVLKLWRK